MARRRAAVFGIILLLIITLASINLAQKQASAPAATPKKNVTKPILNATTGPPTPNVPLGMPVDDQQALVKQYCSGCHNERLKSGGMSLTQLDLAHPEANAELAEKVIRKLRVGLMPPAGRPRPDAAKMASWVTTL